MYACVPVHVSAATYRCQERALYPTELELLVVVSDLMWMLGAEVRNSSRASCFQLLKFSLLPCSRINLDAVDSHDSSLWEITKLDQCALMSRKK